MHSTVLFFGLIGSLLQAQAPPAFPEAPPGQARHEVFLLTMDQGDDVWELFGHNAILIRDRSTGQELAWNWGLFDLGDPDFVSQLVQGTMLYSMGPAPLDAFLDTYRVANRSVYANEIFLTEDEAGRLDLLVRENFEPENRDYVYDYFSDNCSTRARDILDTVLGGTLREAFGTRMTPRSYRWHVRRLVQGTPWVDQGLSVLMGVRADLPRTEWEEMFIPMEMMRLLEGFERPDGQGGSNPLLGPRQVLVQSTRAPTPTAPPPFSFLWLGAGVGVAVVVTALGVKAQRGGRGARAGLVAAAGLWGVFSGLLGSLMVVIWFTDHDFGYLNVNILYMSPLALPLALLLAVRVLREAWWYGTAGRLARRLSLAIAGLSLLAMLLQLLSIVQQANSETLALAIPANIALALALALAHREPARAP